MLEASMGTCWLPWIGWLEQRSAGPRAYMDATKIFFDCHDCVRETARDCWKLRGKLENNWKTTARRNDFGAILSACPWPLLLSPDPEIVVGKSDAAPIGKLIFSLPDAIFWLAVSSGWGGCVGGFKCMGVGLTRRDAELSERGNMVP